MKKIITVVVMLFTLLACKPSNQANPTSIPDGVTSISQAMVSKNWKAEGGKFCRYWVATKKNGGTVTHAGNTRGPASKRVQNPGKAPEQSQGIIFEARHVNHYFHSDGCGGWTHTKRKR